VSGAIAVIDRATTHIRRSTAGTALGIADVASYQGTSTAYAYCVGYGWSIRCIALGVVSSAPTLSATAPGYVTVSESPPTGLVGAAEIQAMAAELTASTAGDPYWNGSPSPDHDRDRRLGSGSR
jgi:hypothetical protein